MNTCGYPHGAFFGTQKSAWPSKPPEDLKFEVVVNKTFLDIVPPASCHAKGEGKGGGERGNTDCSTLPTRKCEFFFFFEDGKEHLANGCASQHIKLLLVAVGTPRLASQT